jgi:hypothetical protein
VGKTELKNRRKNWNVKNEEKPEENRKGKKEKEKNRTPTQHVQTSKNQKKKKNTRPRLQAKTCETVGFNTRYHRVPSDTSSNVANRTNLKLIMMNR